MIFLSVTLLSLSAIPHLNMTHFVLFNSLSHITTLQWEGHKPSNSGYLLFLQITT